MRINFFKIFFAYSIILGIFVANLFYFAYHDLQFAVFAGLVGGLFFGGFMTVYSARRGYTTDVRVSQDIGVKLAYENAFKKCLEAVASLNAKIKLEDKKSGQIKARGFITGGSWGQAIEIDLKKINEGKTWIKVSSKPWWFGQIADLGENWYNVEKIINFLKEYSKD